MTFFGDQPFLCGEGGEARRAGREAESSCRNGFVEERGVFSDSSFLCAEALPGPEHTGAEASSALLHVSTEPAKFVFYELFLVSVSQK